jgi:hypothetical protein
MNIFKSTLEPYQRRNILEAGAGGLDEPLSDTKSTGQTLLEWVLTSKVIEDQFPFVP